MRGEVLQLIPPHSEQGVLVRLWETWCGVWKQWQENPGPGVRSPAFQSWMPMQLMCDMESNPLSESEFQFYKLGFSLGSLTGCDSRRQKPGFQRDCWVRWHGMLEHTWLLRVWYSAQPNLPLPRNSRGRVFILRSAGTGCFLDHVQGNQSLGRTELTSPLCCDP